MLRFQSVERRVLDRRRRGDAGIGDEDVDAAELDRRRRRRRAATAVLVGHVHLDRRARRPCRMPRRRGRPPSRPAPPRRCRRAPRRRPRASSRSAVAAPMPPAPPVTSAIRPARLFGFGMRCSLASSSSQYSMSKASCSGRPRYVRDRRGAAHHVDGVDVELARDARRRLVLGEGDHADAGHQVDHRIRVAHRRAVGALAALVVGGVVRRGRPRPPPARPASVASTSGCAGSKSSTSGRILVRRKWSGQEVPSAASGAHVVGADELQHRRAGRRNGRPCGRPAEIMPRIAGISRAAIAPPLARRRAPRAAAPPKAGLPAVSRLEPGDRPVDDLERGLVAVLGVVAPGEEAVALEHDAVARPGSPRQNFSSHRPSSKPGRLHGSQPISSPKISLRSAPCESFDAAMAMIASGCMWSTCARGT